MQDLDIRVGIGYDVHRLVKERKLVLGGVLIDYEFGLLGHSDSDVLIHAVMDSILGACGLRDIGYYFPDTNQEYKGISSLKLLEKVNCLIKEKGYRVNNIDSIIIAQKPKLSPYILQMRDNIAATLGISPESVGVKATTEEGLGFTGKGEGIAAQAVSSIIRRSL